MDEQLDDTWTMYFHDPNNLNWNIDSYINLGTISCIEDYWNHYHLYKDNAHKAMFFLMREHVFPCWDDPYNIKGGCLSVKVLKENMLEFWEDCTVKLLSEDLLKQDYKKHHIDINGISTSPKKHFCIIKIWITSDSIITDKNFYNFKNIYHGDIIYKLNLENISNQVQPDGANAN